MPFYHLRFSGKVYLPESFSDAVEDDSPIREFDASALDHSSRIFDFIRRGGIALLRGPWNRVTALVEYAEKRKSDLIRTDRAGRGTSLPRHSGRSWERERRRILMRMMVAADDDLLAQMESAVCSYELFELTGERKGANEGCGFVVPVYWLQRLVAAMKEEYAVTALGAGIVVPEPVLTPASQESVSLMAEAFEAIKGDIPSGGTVLDMGCGSGVLSFLAAQKFGDRVSSITATDLLPEALATTKINVERLAGMGKIRSGLIRVAAGGDLFEPVRGGIFDLIIFNAPWVVSRVRGRIDRATHDEGQQTVRRFLLTAGQHLAPSGHVLLQYSDHSGPKAVERLMDSFEENGWRVEREWRARIQARRRHLKWQNVLVYDLRRDRSTTGRTTC